MLFSGKFLISLSSKSHLNLILSVFFWRLGVLNVVDHSEMISRMISHLEISPMEDLYVLKRVDNLSLFCIRLFGTFNVWCRSNTSSTKPKINWCQQHNLLDIYRVMEDHPQLISCYEFVVSFFLCNDIISKRFTLNAPLMGIFIKSSCPQGAI